MILAAVGHLDEDVEVRFGNIPLSLSCEVNLVALKCLGKDIRPENVRHGIPIA
jgi:hypothetical protein